MSVLLIDILLDMSVISFWMCIFSTIVFDIVVVDFDLSLPVGDESC